MTGDLLAVDPGLVNPGAAFMRDGKLLSAQRIKVPKAWAKLKILDRCHAIGNTIVEWCMGQVPDTVVIEWPRWYGETKSGGIDPNDLAGLCGIAGAVVGHFGTGTVILSPTPREVWGNLPKSVRGDPWESPRGRRLASRLTHEERANVAKYHDALDAAGLALYGVGRWQDRKRVFPGAI